MEKFKCSILTVISFFFFIPMYSQSPLAGHWEGAMTREGSVQLLKFDFLQEGDSIETHMDDPAIGFYDCYLDDYAPNQKIAVTDSIFSLDFGYGIFKLYLNKTDREITGISDEWKPAVRVHLKKQGVKEKENFTSENIIISHEDIKLGATLYKPKSNYPCPYVILVHGSQKVTRRTGSYRSIAYVLAQSGIGVLFYDKRGSGQSTGGTTSAEYATLDQLANDVVAARNYLAKQKNLKISKTGLFGISQGGWVVMLAQRKVKVDFLVLNAGPAVSVYQQELDRVPYTMQADGLNKSTIDSATDHLNLYFNVVRNNAGWGQLSASVQAIKQTQWARDYLPGELPENINDRDIVWWQNNNYDPKNDFLELKIPTLSILCGRDRDVLLSSNEPPMRSYLANSGCKYKIAIFPNAEHNGIELQKLRGKKWDWPAKYWIWPKRPDGFYEEIVNWIKASSLLD